MAARSSKHQWRAFLCNIEPAARTRAQRLKRVADEGPTFILVHIHRRSVLYVRINTGSGEFYGFEAAKRMESENRRLSAATVNKG